MRGRKRWKRYSRVLRALRLEFTVNEIAENVLLLISEWSRRHEQAQMEAVACRNEKTRERERERRSALETEGKKVRENKREEERKRKTGSTAMN